ncbi:MAG: D-alanyl-D-alanine carboxypeptidase [Clostridia bacterium]|nr:D-alanyl-D-alanine carboxypeptidase [Clostridia bacterium]
MKFVKMLILILVVIVPENVHAIEVSARNAVLYEPQSQRIIFEKNQDEKRGMASTTKIVTAITALENSNLTDVVTVSKKAADVEGSSVWLEAGEKQTLENLLYGLMLSSGNDAAIAIAEHISGTTEKFALLMNETAKKAGANNSSFKNPNGLDEEGHYTTALDLAKITAYAMENEKFKEIVSTKQKTIPWQGHKWDRSLKNHNKMLSLYEGADGVKTGFTKKCGRCLVSSAFKNGTRLIAVTLNAPNDWDDHTKMLDLGFSLLESKCIVKKDEILGKCSIENGTETVVEIKAQAGFWFPVLKSDKTKINVNIARDVKAPVLKGQTLGFAEIYLNDKKISEIPLIANNDIEVLYIPTIWDNFKILISSLCD